jgi:hypothetical protein
MVHRRDGVKTEGRNYVVGGLMGMGSNPILQDPSVGGNKNRQETVHGIIESTTTFPGVREAMEGIIQTSVPEHKQSELMHSQPTKTKTALGMRHISGSKY